MIKCIIFDNDGTLVDSEYLCSLGLKIKLKEYGVIESASEMTNKFRGAKLAKIIYQLEEKHHITLDSDFIPSYRAIVEGLFNKKLKPIEGIFDALSTIKIPICVASSGPIDKIEQSLLITELKPFFNKNIFSSYEIGSWKPEPNLFIHSAKKMGFKPEECAVVEDSPVGIEASLLANMLPIFYNPHDFYEPIQDAITIGHMQELTKIINRAN